VPEPFSWGAADTSSHADPASETQLAPVVSPPDVSPEESPEVSPEAPSDVAEESVAEYEFPPSMPAQPVSVPGHYHYLKRWTYVLVLAGVWLPAAAAGLALYYWWFRSLDKAWPLFVVLVVVIACTVGGLLLALVEGKPLVTAVALAVMSAAFAATAAAAVLHGAYFFQWIERPG